MKRRNNSKSIMQQGGLMIEALAMLGLIAVVTPTMYKKSAERTMEVEDINSATTIRTIMNAANDYVGANYSTIISDMNKAEGDANKYRPITRAQIEPYLPYGFNMNRALYNYDFPELAIAKNDNNLTTFALFPAKAGADTGIGQERTSRIASLVGASGGYVTENGKARGIGGIWRLEGDAFNKVFPTSGSGANTYSIVTASADTINAATGNEIDMDKYLQRGRDDPNDTSTLWKNTMRTDLYMGVNKSDDDVYKNDAPNKVQDKLYSIRNIKSLIVGAEKTGLDETGNEVGGYGLYIEGSNAGGLTGNPNAFIRGSVRAAQEQFYVTDTKLSYGKFDDTNFNFQIDKETGNTKTIGTLQAAQTQFYVTDTKLGYGNMEDGNFRVEMDKETGNTRIRGTLENDKNVALANSLGNWNTVTIGAVDRYPGRTDGNHAIIIKSSAANAPYGKLTLFDDDVMYVQNKGNNDSGTPDNDRIVMLKGGVKQLPDGTNVPTLSYNTSPTFPMRVGANAKFEGVVAAGQLDTQKIRAASLSVGSEHIDDANKWMTVDKNGVIIRNPDGSNGSSTGSGTQAVFNKDNIFLRMDDEDQGFTSDTAHPMQLNLRRKHGNKNYVTELYGFNTDIRGRDQMNVSGGGVILQATNNMPDYWDTPDSDNQMLKDTVAQNTLMLRNDDIQAKMTGKNLTVSSRADAVDYMNVGDMNTNAGVNVIAVTPKKGNDNKLNIGDSYKKVLTVDVGATSANNNKSQVDDGGVYIRKGYLEVKGKNIAKGETKPDAFGGNGVIVASRFVANNSPDVSTNGGGDAITEFLTTSDYDSGSARYNTYMVNPAYTSVMHDIKLVTRGGARLSDVLPDFINKGIYVVNNTVLENVAINTNTQNYKTISEALQAKSKDTTANLGAADAWASPYLGAVPAPQCPPGYGRVITLNPSAFQMAQAGSLHSDGRSTSGGTYYVAPYAPSTEQAQPSGEPTYEIVNVEGSISGVNGASFVNGKTQKYVLASKLNTGTNPNNSSQPVMPLVFQQSTWLKSMVKPISSGSYVQGWVAIMGFLYPSAQYSAFTGNIANAESADENRDVYWNLFPVARGTLEGYATVYCYFDRTNTVTHDFMDGYGKYIDNYTYMQTMTGVPAGYKKVSSDTYKSRLNDPNMQYNEVW